MGSREGTDPREAALHALLQHGWALMQLTGTQQRPTETHPSPSNAKTQFCDAQVYSSVKTIQTLEFMMTHP